LRRRHKSLDLIGIKANVVAEPYGRQVFQAAFVPGLQSLSSLQVRRIVSRDSNHIS
jgi:hypothetical protein